MAVIPQFAFAVMFLKDVPIVLDITKLQVQKQRAERTEEISNDRRRRRVSAT